MGSHANPHNFYSSSPVYAYLEFESAVDEVLREQFASTMDGDEFRPHLEKEVKSTSLNSNKDINASGVSIDPEDDKTMILQFNEPPAGACFNLKLPDMDGFLFQNSGKHSHICFSLC